MMNRKIKKVISVVLCFVIGVSFTFGNDVGAKAEISADASMNAGIYASSDSEESINENTHIFTNDGNTVSLMVEKKNSWNDGYIADVTLKNIGDKTLVNWHIDLDITGEVEDVWNAEYKKEDNKVTFSYPSWSRKIKSGESYTFGMKVKGDFSNIGAFKYYEDVKDVSELYKIEYKVENTWDDHAIIKAIITNTGETTLRDWTLNIAYDADIVDIWDACVVSHEANLYMLKNKEYNADIEPNKSVTLGFQAQYEGNEVVLPTNSNLIAVADSKLVEVETDKVDWYRVMTNADSPEAARMRENVKDRVKVAIIDSGVDFMGENDEINRVDFIGDTDEENPIYDDRSGHGTGVAGMLLGVNNGDEGEVEEETTEEETADVDFSYLTDADYIEAVDTPEEEDDELEVSDEEYDDEDYDDSEYTDYDDTDDVEDIEESDEESDNDVIDDDSDSPDETEEIDDSDSEEDLDDDLNLFEYNELYGDLSGLNPNIDLTSLRVLDEDNEAPVSRVIEAIEWAIDNDINILNLSWGTDVDNPELHNLIKKAYNKGMLIIAAAGNEGKISYPAAYDEVIAVGSVDSQGKVTADAVSGDAMELVAPAEEIIAYNSFGILAFSSGTSYAAPQVTALASILWQQDITVSNRCIRTLLRESSSALGDRNLYGYGIIDYQKAAGMYEEFINNYEETSVIGEDDSTEDVINKDIDEVSTIDEQYVQGLWAKHHEMIISTDTEVNDIIRVLKAGVMWPDNVKSGIQGMSKYPKYHGGGDYVESYITIMKRAKIFWNTGKWSVKDKTGKQIKKAVKAYNNLKKKEFTGCNEGIDVTNNIKKIITLDTVASSNASADSIKKYSAAFVMGIAMHTFGDVFAHRAYGLRNHGAYYYGQLNKYTYNNKQISIDKQCIPNKLFKIIHGIRKTSIEDKKRKISKKNKKILRRIAKESKGDYVDNRADSNYMHEKRYDYTQRLYEYIVRNRVNSSEDAYATAGDYVACDVDYKYSIDSTKNRIQSMVESFGIEGLRTNIDKHLKEGESINDETLNIIDVKSVMDRFNNWSWLELNLPKDELNINTVDSIRVYKSSGDGVSEDSYLVADASKDGTLYLTGETASTISYSFIGDVNSKYNVIVEITDNSNNSMKASFSFESGDKHDYSSDCGYTNNVSFNAISSGEEYNIKIMKLAKEYRPYKYTMFTKTKINIPKDSFKTVEVTGSVKELDTDSAIGGALIKVYDANNMYITSGITTDEGMYSFSGKTALYPGVYNLVLDKVGYIEKCMKAVVKSQGSNNLETVFLESDSEDLCKKVHGKIYDSVSKEPINDLDLYLIEGKNNPEGERIAHIVLSGDGSYCFENVRYGDFTVMIQDNRNVSEDNKYLDGIIQFTASSGNVSVDDCYMTTKANGKRVRFIYTRKKTSFDLDSHLSFSDAKGRSCDCSYNNKKLYYKSTLSVSFDCFVKEGYKTETITLHYPEDRQYLYFIRNYSRYNLDEIRKTEGVVQVYYGSSNIPSCIVIPPQKDGYYWTVLKYDGKTGKVIPVNNVYVG